MDLKFNRIIVALKINKIERFNFDKIPLRTI